MGSSAAWDAEHRIVLDDLVSTLEHELHAAEASEGFPATLDVPTELSGDLGLPEPSDWRNKVALVAAALRSDTRAFLLAVQVSELGCVIACTCGSACGNRLGERGKIGR